MTKTECGICGSEAKLVVEEREVRVGKRSAIVEDQFFRCGGCGEELYEGGQASAVMRRASAAIREEIGLLQPEEIRAVRKSFELSQAKFERLLQVGAKTVVRWERGTVFQGQTTDVLIRAVRDFPGFAEYLAERAEVDVPKRESREIAPQPFLEWPELGADELVESDRYVPPGPQEYPVDTGGFERTAA